MRALRIGKDLVPVNEFRSNLADWLDRLGQSGQAIVVTQRGRAAAVVVRPEDIDAYEEQRELVDKVLAGLREAGAGQTVADHDVWKRVDDVIAAAEKRHGSDVGAKRGTKSVGSDDVHRKRAPARRKKARS